MKAGPLLLLLLLVSASFAVVYFRPLSVVGPEGLDVKIVALNYDGELINRSIGSVNNYVRVSLWDDKALKLVKSPDGEPNLNCRGQPGICEYGPEWYYTHDGGEFLFEVSRPQLIADFTPPNGWRSIDSSHTDLNQVKEVEWVNYLPNGTVVKRVGELIPAEFIIQLSSQGREGYFGLYQWRNIDVWMELYGVSWSPYDPNPPRNNDSGYWTLVNEPRAYIVPLITWVKAGTPWLWKDQNGNMVGDSLPYSDMQNWLSYYPDIAGRELTMYYSVNEYYGRIPNHEELINGNPLKYVVPDPRMTDEVFIHVHVDKYGPYAHTECGLWTSITFPCCTSPKLEIYYPASYLKVRTILLVWGEFHYVWTQREAQQQQYTFSNRSSENITYVTPWNPFSGLAGLGKWLSTPDGFLTLLVIAAALFVVLGLILMFLGGGKVIIIRR